MKTRILAALFVVLLLAPSVIAAQKEGIAVGRIRNSASLPGSYLSVLDDMFISAIHATGKFNVVERKQLADIEEEQELAESWKIDQTDPNLARINQLTGARYYVLGNITSFQDEQRRSSFADMGVTVTERLVRLTMDIRISDTTTGRVVQTAVVTREKKDFDTQTPGVSEGSWQSDLVQDVLRETVAAAALAITDAIFPIEIITREETDVYLNRGEGGGIKLGMTLDVYRPGKELRDPRTGAVLGTTAKKVGAVLVQEVLPGHSRAVVIQDEGISSGDICRAQ